MQGAVFAGVGFAAGLVGTAMSNGLLAARKKLDPEFKSQNQAPDVALNAATWAAHMGVSSNLRYQVLNGIDMARPAWQMCSASNPGCRVGTRLLLPSSKLALPHVKSGTAKCVVGDNN